MSLGLECTCNVEFCSCKATLYTCSVCCYTERKKHVQCAEKLYACMLSPLLGGGTMPLPLPPPLSRVMNEAEEMGRGLLCWGGGGNHIRDFSTLTFFCSQRCVLTRQNTFVVTNNSFGESCISSKGAPQKLLSGVFPLRGRGRWGTPQFAKKNSYFWPKNANFSPFSSIKKNKKQSFWT